MLDGNTMKPEPDFGLQAAHMFISELMSARLELAAHVLALRDQLQKAEQRIEELEAKVSEDVLAD